jgi:Peptidase family S41
MQPALQNSTAVRRKTSAARAAKNGNGRFLQAGAFSAQERLDLIDAVERIIEGVYAHLPLKRARYCVDPIQRLRILRAQAGDFDDDGFHFALADILTRLRDAHTRYSGPGSLGGKVAVLPFLIEMIGATGAARYVVTRVGEGLPEEFKPGVLLEYWNGVPIDRAVQRYSDNEVGGRPDSQRAWAVQTMTFRSLQFCPPPDEEWVIAGFRSAGSGGAAVGALREVRIPWRVIDAGTTDPFAPDSGGRVDRNLTARGAVRRQMAVNPAAAAVRRAKMMLFAPGALKGKQASVGAAKKNGAAGGIIPTRLTAVLKAMSIDAPGGPFGYLRIYGFDSAPAPFLAELMRLVALLPDRGLIIDIRGNPGGYILASEFALQLFTPRHISPTRFSLLATPFTRDLANSAPLRREMKPWLPSLAAALRNGELYSQPVPISDPMRCNAIGQRYGGPVVLVGDATTYSAGDLFAAGFVDNGIGPFICVGQATGAGGANVWDYASLRKTLAATPMRLPALPDDVELTFSFRRATRAGAAEGLPIEDAGIEGAPYAMTRDDLLAGNRDLIAHCIGLLKKAPFSRLDATLDKPARKLVVASEKLDRIDVFFDGRADASIDTAARATTHIDLPRGTASVELRGFAAGNIVQRRIVDTAR